MKTKSPGKRDHRHPHNHTPTVKRWAERKCEEEGQKEEERIQLVQDFGSRRRAAKAFGYMKAARAYKQKEEKEMLANTSLKDIIK